MNIDSLKEKGTEVSDQQSMVRKKKTLPHINICNALVSPQI